jgi:hypothetical protein
VLIASTDGGAPYGPTPRRQSGATTEHAACRSPAPETSRAATTSPPCPSFASPAAPRSPRTTSARHRRSDPSGPHRSPEPQRGASDGLMRRLVRRRMIREVTNEPLSVPVGDEASLSLVDPSWEIPMVQAHCRNSSSSCRGGRTTGKRFHEPGHGSDRATVDGGESDGRRAAPPATSHFRRGSRVARHRPHVALLAGLGGEAHAAADRQVGALQLCSARGVRLVSRERGWLKPLDCAGSSCVGHRGVEQLGRQPIVDLLAGDKAAVFRRAERRDRRIVHRSVVQPSKSAHVGCPRNLSRPGWPL